MGKPTENLNGLRKEYLQNASFRMILREALTKRPEHQPFNPLSGQATDVQVEQWKAKSAQREGFDLAFRMITGIKPEDFNND